MTLYYFDIRDNDGLIPDDEGMELLTLTDVEEEAARSLADMAREAVLRTDELANYKVAIEARDDQGLVLRVRLAFEVDRLRTQ